MNTNLESNLVEENAVVEEAAQSNDIELALHELDMVGGGSISAHFA